MFDRDHALAFLRALYTGAPGYLNLCYLDTRGRLLPGKFFRCDDDGLRRAADYAKGLDDLPAKAVYHRVTTTATVPDHGRGGAADTLHTPALWGDVDYGHDGHKGDDLPPTREDARAVIADCGMPEPTILVHSGGGYYPLWTLDRPVGMAEAAVLAERVQHALAAASARRGWTYGTGVKDLARVLRLPGSTNWKTAEARPCRVVGGNGQAISPDAVPNVAPPAPAPGTVLPPRVGPHDPNRERGVLDVLDRVTWAQLLEPAGWTYRGHDGSLGSERWLRPGDATSDYSARCFEHNMVCHSESAGLPSGAGQRLTKARVYAWLHYGGDVSAAARALIAGDNPAGLPAAVFDDVRAVMAARDVAAWAALGVTLPDAPQGPTAPAGSISPVFATAATEDEMRTFLTTYTRYTDPGRLGRRIVWAQNDRPHRLAYHARQIVDDVLAGRYPADRALDALRGIYAHHGGQDPAAPRTLLGVALGAILNAKVAS